MDLAASPILLYIAAAIGALGVALALPRRGLSPQLLGTLVAALGLGGIYLALALRSGPGNLPNYNFYIFSAIALFGALRVISHPRPVYAALYFILTILASCGLYVLLSAEFMAFALVIVYAGAILITYLFVIMLATESPTSDAVEALSDYDRYSREPILATIIGFVLVAGLTTLIARGSASLPPATEYASGARLSLLPRKVEAALRQSGAIDADEHLARAPDDADGNPGEYLVQLSASATGAAVGSVVVEFGEGERRTITSEDEKWPADLQLANVEGVGFTLLADHPGGIEIAGVVLLMAMLGAVVLSRKKVELDERLRREAPARLSPTDDPYPADPEGHGAVAHSIHQHVHQAQGAGGAS